MATNLPLILFFDQINQGDHLLVGGKNASLAEMYQHLSDRSIKIPYGFAITTHAYEAFIKFNKLNNALLAVSSETNGKQVRDLIAAGRFPDDLISTIIQAYKVLSNTYGEEATDVAVRSSSVSEDSVTNSFAGQQDTYLNIRGLDSLLLHIKKCFASLYTDRVIVYRKGAGLIDTDLMKMSICVQKMVRSDAGAAGVAFTIDTESGFRDAIIINASFGLGELVVGGLIDPDEYTIFKKTGEIIDKKLGSKKSKLIYDLDLSPDGCKTTKIIPTSPYEQSSFALGDSLISQLGEWALKIEEHYANVHQRAVDVEWAFDGFTNELFIVQARPITTIATIATNAANTTNKESGAIINQYSLTTPVEQRRLLLSGIAVGDRISSGRVRKMTSYDAPFTAGDVLVVDSTTPDWEPIMKIASAIVTNRGGRTCHAAIIAREQGMAAIVGTGKATEILEDGVLVTVSCVEGEVGQIYCGKLDWLVQSIDPENLLVDKNAAVAAGVRIPEIMFNLASPEIAFKTAMLPNSGVGLAREEFIINNFIKIHPLALINYDSQPADIKDKIDTLIAGYSTGTEYYVEKLAFGMAKIAAAFYPNDVILRFSDFKSNEYRNLLGGAQYEPMEENPMIGWRGASRYYSPEFAEAFGLECQAVKRVRDQMQLKNLVVMIPFCRTPGELERVYETMAKFDLRRGQNDLRVFLMAEIPSNVILAEQFSRMIDGFSIGSNDLTQLVLGLDRDSHLVSHIYDERNEAVQIMLAQVIKVAKKNGVKIGICGQAISDHSDLLKFLIDAGIDSISITPDALFKVTQTLKDMILTTGI